MLPEITNDNRILPNELWFNVFINLKPKDQLKIPYVCTWWGDIFIETSRICFTKLFKKKLPEDFKEKVTAYYRNRKIESIWFQKNLKACDNLNTQFTQLLADWPNADTFSLPEVLIFQLTTERLEELVKAKPFLRTFEIPAYYLPAQYLTDEGFTLLLKNTGRLRKIDLLSCPHLTQESLLQIPETNPKVRHLTLKGTLLTDQVLDHLLKNLEELRHLCLSGQHQLSPASIASYASTKTLKVLQIETAQFPYSNPELHKLISLLPKLTELALVRTQITDETVLALTNHQTNLQVLKLETWHIASLQALVELATKLRGLKQLNLRLEKTKKFKSTVPLMKRMKRTADIVLETLCNEKNQKGHLTGLKYVTINIKISKLN